MAIDLRLYTPARVSLGRTGHSVPTTELLRFQLDHARARDAVYDELDPATLSLPHKLLHSAAQDRRQFLRRPDLGRMLSDESRARLQKGDYDLAIVMADGLSATAVHRHAEALLLELTPLLEAEHWSVAPLTVVLQGRVAIGDEIGERLGARLVAVLIGERPGLTSPDSLGVYLTWDPRSGRNDSERNCISNIRAEGVSYRDAAIRLHFLLREARARKLTGVGLKDEAPLLRLATRNDVPAISALIEQSVLRLQAGDYSKEQMEGALGSVFGVDRRLIEDGTYFVVEAAAGELAGCGGWSRRKTLFGSDAHAARDDEMLDPAQDAAKIRAFFVHPDWARRGIGSRILEACESAAAEAGFSRFEMGATLTGERLYAVRGYVATDRIEVPLTNGETLPVIRMIKSR